MAIEFRCPQCGKLLRTGDDTAGRQAQCPSCGVICTVPGGSDVVSPEGLKADSPFAGQAAASVPQGVENPYVSPDAASGQTMQAMATSRVSGPAVALIVVAIIGFVGHILITAVYGFMTANIAAGDHSFIQPGDNPKELLIGSVIFCGLGIFGMVADAVVLIGAVRMRSLRGYGFAMVAAVLALIPGISPCCLLGLPFGIWAIVVLSDASVKAAFYR
jgi:hypothetical protein